MTDKKPEQIHFTDVEGINRFSNEQRSTFPLCTRVTEEMIAAFANVTDNHQWIHKPHKDVANDPYDGQIAHGLLLLSLVPSLLDLGTGVFEIVGHRVRIIRGFDRIRFIRPVRPGDEMMLTLNNLKAYSAKSGKGTVVEQDIDLWVDYFVWPETVVTGRLKLQYF